MTPLRVHLVNDGNVAMMVYVCSDQACRAQHWRLELEARRELESGV